jgi:type I restriction enzyme, R subunit
MAKEYSEDVLIEQTSINLFTKALKWETLNLQVGETFGEEGTVGRVSEEQIILPIILRSSLEKLNSNLPDTAYSNAIETLTQTSSSQTLPEINHEKYQFLRDGIRVTYKNEKGEIIRNKKLKVFDFNTPEANHFLAIQQLWIEGKSKRKRRPDIIGFVNGIPLLFIELKAHHKKLKVAFEKNLTDYKDTIPQLFHFNAFIILSNGLESKIGSITSRYEHFKEWKRIKEEEEGVVSLETIIKGVCEKNRFMDLFENFILYDDSIGSTVKLVGRNHQFIGVNKAIEHFKHLQDKFERGEIAEEEKRKLGVFWHTQGSGKSYSMVFLAQKIHRKFQGTYTFIVVTDRLELDKQISGTFKAVGAIGDKDVHADSGKDLKKLLKTDNRYIFTLIHKFNFTEEITERKNIIVLSDEAHRTQGGSLALNMRNAMPSASFMGFTGTPLFKDDELTKRIFGDYVSVYNFKKSVEDGATVPLYYENRGEKLNLDNPEVNDEIRQAIEDADLDSDQEDKLKKLFSREYPILTAEKRLKSIAKDIVWHFNRRGYKGKGMMVALDKVTAVKMYNFITEEWMNYINEQEKEIGKIPDDQEQLIRKRGLDWTKKTEIAVVVSSEQNEIEKFRNWGLDVEPHRLKMNTRDLETEFKDEDHPFRLVIVCAMWITGFDVPSLSTMYLDKPIKSHTLMQTIARANRVHQDKNNGLIVDYIETYKRLLEALAIYAIGGSTEGPGGGGGPGGDQPVEELEKLIEELQKALKATKEFLKKDVDFDLSEIISNDELEKLAAIQNGLNAINTNDQTKAKFGVLAREVFKKYKALMPNQAIYQYRDEKEAIDALYKAIQDNIDESDISGVMADVQKVVDKAIEVRNLALEPVVGWGNKVDISGLDFDLIEREFKKTIHKNTLVQDLKSMVENKLNQMLNKNPLRIDFYEKYQEIIEEYNEGKDKGAIERVFQQLRDLAQDLTEEDARSKAEGLNEDQLTLFDILRKGKELNSKEKKKVKEIAVGLLEELENDQLKVDHWMDKTQTSAAVKTTINDFLFEELPYPTYQEEDIDKKTFVLFEHFRSNYKIAG